MRSYNKLYPIVWTYEEAAKALIGILEDEIIAEKIGLKLEEVKKLH